MSNTIDYNALLGDSEPSDPTQDPGSDTTPDPGSDPGSAAPQLPDAGSDLGNGPTPSPYDLVAQATGANNPTPDGTGSPYDIVAQGIANAPATPPGQTGRPLTAEERLFQNENPNGGSFTNPQAGAQIAGNGRPLTVEEQNAQGQVPNGGTISASGVASPNPAGPQLPNPGVGTAAPGATGGNDRFVRDAAGNVTGVKSENGYYDANFQSVRNMEDNYQRGDRMAGTVEGLQLLANAGNQDAARILGAEKATGSNMMNSALEADWAKAHNTQIQDTLAGMTGKNANGAAAANLQGQMAPVNATPGTTAQDFPMAQKMMDNLDKVPGVVAGSVTMDKYGNVVFQDQSGTRHIPMNEWADWAPVIADRANAGATTNNTTSTGGGAPPRGGSPTRGGGSGGSGGSGGTTPSTRTIFDSQAHRDAANAHAANTESIRNYGNTNFQPTGPLDGPGIGDGVDTGNPFTNAVGDIAGGVGNAAGGILNDGRQLAGAGVQAVGNALFGNNMPQPAEALPVGAPPSDGTNSIDDWIRVARQKGIIP